jgi:hypothetical protein
MSVILYVWLLSIQTHPKGAWVTTAVFDSREHCEQAAQFFARAESPNADWRDHQRCDKEEVHKTAPGKAVD